ncbi:MAG: DNA adenine methylase, partial [Clostridia bacterium]|nr:DNA adenine methylase [Clostridia bacterium]
YFYSRDIFNECKENLKRDNLPYIDKAISFYYVANCCYGGKLITPAFGYSKIRNEAKTFRNKVEKIDLIIDRLKDVFIENLDFEDLINKYDSSDTFFYCDPPYDLNRSCRAYEHPWNEDYEKRLVDCLLKIKGKVLLTVYDNDTYNRLTEYGWQKNNITVFSSITGNLRKIDSTHRTETIYMNYEQDKQEEIDLREDIKDDRRSTATCHS